MERTIGRLFFVDRGEDESRTATLVAAANNDPQWTDKVRFAPGFRDNSRPYGEFVARTATFLLPRRSVTVR